MRGVSHRSEHCLNQGKKKHININNFAGLSRDWVGAKNLFMCFFFRAIPYGGEKTHKQNSPQNPGTIPGKFCLRGFVLYVFFRSLLKDLQRHSFKIFSGILSLFSMVWSLLSMGWFSSRVAARVVQRQLFGSSHQDRWLGSKRRKVGQSSSETASPPY